MISSCVHFNRFIRCDMSKYDEVYFVGDNQVINRVRIGSSETRNQGAFSGSLASLPKTKSQVPLVMNIF